MYYDLNFPVAANEFTGASQSKKKGKHPQQSAFSFTPAQLASIEARLDLLVHLGYNVIAFNQTINKKIDPKTHVNILNALLSQLKTRSGVLFLKRLTIVLDEESEKGFGLASANTAVLDPYDIIALVPTTTATFSSACLTHSLPSPLTAHIISLQLTSPRLPFHLKHTLVRTAIKNGAVFEINYVGALGDSGTSSSALGVSDTGPSAKRNWWAAAREVVRVTKGKGIIVSSGALTAEDYRGPRDVQNLICLLGLAQNFAHDASAVTPKSLLIRAQTRKTYRAVLSEPKLIFPPTPQTPDLTVKSADLSTRQAPQAPSNDHAATADDPSNIEANNYESKKRVREDSISGSTTLNPSGSSEGPASHSVSNSSRRPQKKGKLVA
ncbi:RNase P subunit p30-domain-containing protein [Pisolithus microcarpus]|nr:RNase P subunit p30-domain-containing protein [Pisolithus microcarpus]